ncbi:MAG: STAS/SEC14 domain-containing protein [Bacteroidota bacterium]
MSFATFDERAFPLVHVTIEDAPSPRAIDAFLEHVEDLLEGPERLVVIVEIAGPRLWKLGLSERHRELIEDMKDEAEDSIAAIAYVAGAEYVARALDFAMQQAALPFPVRVFQHADEARRWAAAFVA